MTDPDFADATYIEPITPEVVAKIIERERPDAVLPTLGGQTGLNTAMALFERGLIGVPGTPEMIGANAEAIATAEDREQVQAGDDRDRPRRPEQRHRPHPRRGDGGRRADRAAGHHPPGVHPRWSWHRDRLDRSPSSSSRAADGLAASPISEILIEKSIAGWKEFELEVMRDRADNCVIICSIENVDPMGVHTGDSITVAPAQTLSDVEYQQMRDAAFACIRRVGVETGGSNVQFAVEPGDRRAGRDRDEPARVAIVGAGVEGDRLPDRQDRRQVGGRLHARRDQQRHHRRRHRPASSRASTTSSPRSRGGRSRSCPGHRGSSARRCNRSAR